MGDWVYYLTRLKMKDIAERVSFADELHESRSLNDLIQREVTLRAVPISEYLQTQPQRFFNALVIGVYGGDPQWYEIGLKPNSFLHPDDVPQEVKGALGILILEGDESLFAIDGQHRVKGIKSAVLAKAGLSQEEVASVFVSHRRDVQGLKRTRRLFTTLNRYAKPVTKSEIIARDEDDIRDLKNGSLDCIVQVAMLGEGFDHPKLSVAAIFRPFRSLAPYIQFVGRILRVVVQNDPTHPDNYGHIVTHVGLNLDEQLKRFKQFENDDQAFWEEVTGGDEPEPPRKVLDGKTRMKLREFMVVNSEIVDRVFEEEFTTAEDADIVADLERKLESLGLDPSLAKDVIKKSASTRPGVREAGAAQPFAVLPVRQWQEGKRRLNEEVKRTANLLLNRCELIQAGVDIPRKLKPDIGAQNNFVAALQMVNEQLDKNIGKGRKRAEWTTDEFKSGIDSLPGILDALTREIKKLQDVKK